MTVNNNWSEYFDKPQQPITGDAAAQASSSKIDFSLMQLLGYLPQRNANSKRAKLAYISGKPHDGAWILRTEVLAGIPVQVLWKSSKISLIKYQLGKLSFILEQLRVLIPGLILTIAGGRLFSRQVPIVSYKP